MKFPILLLVQINYSRFHNLSGSPISLLFLTPLLPFSCSLFPGVLPKLQETNNMIKLRGYVQEPSHQKTNTLSRLRCYTSEKKAKLLLYTVETSCFQYCPLIWLFCSKAADSLVSRTTKRAMRIIYNSDTEEALDALLQRDGTLAIHKKNYKN